MSISLTDNSDGLKLNQSGHPELSGIERFTDDCDDEARDSNCSKRGGRTEWLTPYNPPDTVARRGMDSVERRNCLKQLSRCQRQSRCDIGSTKEEPTVAKKAAAKKAAGKKAAKKAAAKKKK